MEFQTKLYKRCFQLPPLFTFSIHYRVEFKPKSQPEAIFDHDFME